MMPMLVAIAIGESLLTEADRARERGTRRARATSHDSTSSRRRLHDVNPFVFRWNAAP